MSKTYEKYCLVDRPILTEQRCHQCRWYLFSCTGEIEVEIVCPKCHAINYTGTGAQTNLRGMTFHEKALQHRCLKCQRFLFKSIGLGFVERTCMCTFTTLYDTGLMRSPNVHFKVKLSQKSARLQQSLAR